MDWVFSVLPAVNGENKNDRNIGCTAAYSPSLNTLLFAAGIKGKQNRAEAL